jgi:hypothetical protein
MSTDPFSVTFFGFQGEGASDGCYVACDFDKPDFETLLSLDEVKPGTTSTITGSLRDPSVFIHLFFSVTSDRQRDEANR